MAKYKPTPIQFPPANDEEKQRWGFEYYQPVGQAYAWILDWTSAGPASGLSRERLHKVLNYDVPEDLGQVSLDDVYGALGYSMKYQWHQIFATIEEVAGEQTARDVAWSHGYKCGVRNKTAMMKRWGEQILPRIEAWYQDIAHMIYGPESEAYAWFDDVKAVCSRPNCGYRPPEGMECTAKFCVHYDYAFLAGYMDIDKKLLCFMGPHLGDDGCQGKCVHMWTYDPEVASAAPDSIKAMIPERIKKTLQERGMKF